MNDFPVGYSKDISDCNYCILRFDGLCAPINPCGIAIGSYSLRCRQELLIARDAELICRDIPSATNNTAEWAGLVIGLRKAVELRIKNLMIIGDSKIVIESLKHDRMPSSAHLEKWKIEAHEILKNFNWSCQFLRREFNEEADELGNQLLEKIIVDHPYVYPADYKHWTNHPVSEKQLKHLKCLNIPFDATISKGEASKLISKHKKSKKMHPSKVFEDMEVTEETIKAFDEFIKNPPKKYVPLAGKQLLPKEKGHYFYYILDLHSMQVGSVHIMADNEKHREYLEDQLEKSKIEGKKPDFHLYQTDDGTWLTMYFDDVHNKPYQDDDGMPLHVDGYRSYDFNWLTENETKERLHQQYPEKHPR